MTADTTAPPRSTFRRTTLVAKTAVPMPADDGSFVDAGNRFIRIIRPETAGQPLTEYAVRHRAAIRVSLTAHGGVLFRGFNIPAPATFGAAARIIAGDLLGYVERAAARSEVAPEVFTSTEFSPDCWIHLHHEMSFARALPAQILFCADEVAAEGGGTPVASERRATARFDPAVTGEFARRGILYRRNFGPEIDLGWRDAFQTDRREEVEAYCRDNDIRCIWLDGEHLRTEQVRDAFLRHPETGERLWCNHAHMFHLSSMDPAIAGALIAEFGEAGLPRNACFGDGGPIPAEMLDHIRTVYDQEMRRFPWQRGDVLALDNLLSLHGREPFKGTRRTLVSMANLINRRDA